MLLLSSANSVCRVSFSLRFALGLKLGYLYSDAKIIKNDKIQNKNARKNWGECDVSLFFDDNMGFVERNGRFVDVGTPQQASQQLVESLRSTAPLRQGRVL